MSKYHGTRKEPEAVVSLNNKWDIRDFYPGKNILHFRKVRSEIGPREQNPRPHPAPQRAIDYKIVFEHVLWKYYSGR